MWNRRLFHMLARRRQLGTRVCRQVSPVWFIVWCWPNSQAADVARLHLYRAVWERFVMDKAFMSTLLCRAFWRSWNNCIDMINNVTHWLRSDTVIYGHVNRSYLHATCTMSLLWLAVGHRWFLCGAKCSNVPNGTQAQRFVSFYSSISKFCQKCGQAPVDEKLVYISSF